MRERQPPPDDNAIALHQALKLLRKLSPRQASIVEMYFLESYELEEIAQITRQPGGKVKFLLWRGVGNLRMLLGPR